MSDTKEVTIIGAGPSGLECALVLAKHGVSVQVIERDAGPISQSRAMFIHVRTLELWDRLGLAREALKRGAPITALRFWTRGRETACLPVDKGLTHDTTFPHAMGLGQSETQQMLLDALSEYPNCRIRWSTSLTGIRQNNTGVQLTIETQAGPQTLASDYVVAADGSKSQVRTLLNIPFEGKTYERGQFAADVILPIGSLPTDAMTSCTTADSAVSAMPISSDTTRFRLFGFADEELERKLKPDYDVSRLTLDDINAWYSRFFPHSPTPTHLLNAAAYRIHKKLASRFREGRIFLIGDAVHIHSPAGGQGVNNSMGDGFNLGWKLALVCTGQAHETLLDSYEAERIPVGQKIVAGASLLYESEADQSLGARISQRVVVVVQGLIVRLPVVQRFITRLMSQTWVSYPKSPVVQDFGPKRGLRAGDRVPTTPVYKAFRWNTLQHHLLVFDGLTSDNLAIRQALEVRLNGLSRQFAIDIGMHPIRRWEQELHNLFGASKPLFALIRPDGHLMFRGQSEQDIEKLISLLGQFYRPASASAFRPEQPVLSQQHPINDNNL